MDKALVPRFTQIFAKFSGWGRPLALFSERITMCFYLWKKTGYTERSSPIFEVESD
ncbi:hypothetical protein K0M31_017721 [Melipona bicolor]|uniref:Uncharacterized protein n=1 Tax=Melipona bicolor TaxID=60889 RepID=A0AA40G5E8_9HYME|nr:hypothetical protein K0M31_017721 [Melipona bicolor]